MAYILYADVDGEITEIGQYVPPGKTVVDFVNNKIASAELEINGKLSSRYLTPVTSAQDILKVKAISLNMTCYYILRQSFTGEVGNTSEWAEEYRKAANDALDMILEGKISLSGTTTTTSDDQILSSTTGVARKFTDGTFDESGNTLTDGTMDGF